VDESLRSFGVLAIVVARAFKPSSLAHIMHLLDYSGRPLDVSWGEGTDCLPYQKLGLAA
jgi:hypothetical protein